MTSNLPIAPLWRRIAAMFYDTFLLIGVLSLATFLFHWLSLKMTGDTLVISHNSGEVVTDLPTTTSGPIYQFYLFFIIGLFFTYFWQKLGQTLGMQAWRLRVCQPDGSNITYQQALVRYLVAWPAFICLGLGYLWSLFHPQGSSWQDLTSKTQVVVMPKRK
ncbi:hypothetical protein SIN8267_00911 [Sinobacterium norvegicum]|uniref:RDD domain-containing protein n=1 Tax=Sinobacterium norvegicum TaxID=1641715 RepID=A0ABM9ADN8_9GAMM|nr:RDD family protein [Sinobacterium norvegicum]CAH0990811.1 hypothetical protein SIN8267_00911 [Sinobacterium norvegicum]